MLERDLIENGTKETVMGCHCYEFNGDYYAFYEDTRIRYTTAAEIDMDSLPITVYGYVWKSDLPRVKCKDCPFYDTCDCLNTRA